MIVKNSFSYSIARFCINSTAAFTLVTSSAMGGVGAAYSREAYVTFHEALVNAADRGQSNLVVDMLKEGYPVNARGAEGVSSLMRSAARGHNNIVRTLIDQGAAVNAKDAYGRTALSYAIDNNQPETARILLENGADINHLTAQQRQVLKSYRLGPEYTAQADAVAAAAESNWQTIGLIAGGAVIAGGIGLAIGGDPGGTGRSSTPGGGGSETALQYGLTTINTNLAYNNGATGAGVIVAVVDSGVDTDHADLAANISGNLSGTDISDGDNDPNPEINTDYGAIDSHGTHVAGTIAAVRGNGVGTHGVAYEATILPIRIDFSGGASETDLGNGVALAVTKNARVINNSWGTINGAAPSEDASDYTTWSDYETFFPTVAPAIQSAMTGNKVVVFAAGNDGNNQPSINSAAGFGQTGSAVPFMITGTDGKQEFNQAAGVTGAFVVAVATDSNNNLSGAAFANSNKCGVAKDYCFAAPGQSIYSTTPDDTFASASGTSMAAPHLSGAFALVLDRHSTITAADAFKILRETATDLGAAGIDSTYGLGLINVGNAVAVGTSVLSNTSSGAGAILSGSRLKTSGVFGSRLAHAASGVGFTAGHTFMRGTEREVSFSYDHTIGQFAEISPSYEVSAYDAYRRMNGVRPQMVEIDERTSFYLRPYSTYGQVSGEQAYFSYGATSSTIEPSGREEGVGALSFTRSFGGSSVNVGYDISMAQAMSFTRSMGDAQPRFIMPSAFSNPYLAFFTQSDGDGTQADIRHASFSHMIASDMAFTATVFDGQMDEDYFGDDAGEATGFMGEISTMTNDMAGYFQLGMIAEDESFLGAQSDGAFKQDGAQTWFYGVGGAWDIADNTSVFAHYTAGITQINSVSDSLLESSDIISHAFGLGVAQNNIYSEGDTLSFSLSSPLRAVSGGLSFSTPTYYSSTGVAQFVNQEVSAKTSGQELDFEASYSSYIAANSILRMGGLYRHEPGHVKGAEPEFVGLFSVSHGF